MVNFNCPPFIKYKFHEEKEHSWCRESECDNIIEEKPRSITSTWGIEEEHLMQSLCEVLTTKWQELARIEVVEAEIHLLKERCELLEQSSPILVPIQSLITESYEIIKPFNAVVKMQGDEYIASFFDANLSASGDTQTEAVYNLKDIIVGAFEILTEIDQDKLGPVPAQQKKIIEMFIRKI